MNSQEIDAYTKKARKKVINLIKKNETCPVQRTPEWYAARNTRITASEAASCLYKSQKVCQAYVNEFNLQNFKYKENECLNPYETREDYIIKKCSAAFGENVFKDSIFTLWGKKYEEIANRLYCKLYNTTVNEFGLMPHSRLKWLAASPDGITPDGIMLEIKCPKARKIDPNAPPLYYWIQTQIQMHTVDLDFCDFFECEITEVEKQEFLEIELKEFQDKGILLQINDSGPDPKFIYPPMELNTTQDYINWEHEYMTNSPGKYTPICYFITKYNNIRIKRSKEWFEAVKDDIKETWKIIMNLQANKEDFEKYKQSIYELRNKDYLDRYHQTECLINHDHNSTFVFASLENYNEAVDYDSGSDSETSISEKCMID